MPKSTSTRPRALLVTRNFPPLVGGMENVNARILSELSVDWGVALSGPQGSAAFATRAVRTSESRIKPLPRFLVETFFKTLVLALRFRPKLVLAGSGLAAPAAWFAARLTGAKLVVYLHGLDIVAPSRIYQILWLPFIRACDLALVNSSHTAGLAHRIGLCENLVQILHPGTEMPVLDAKAGASFRAEHRFQDRPLLLSVGRLTRRKGLAEFVRNALPAILAQVPSALLVVVGEEASDAIHSAAGSERGRIESAAADAGVGASLCFIGRQTDEALGAAYQAAQVHVFPVLEQVGDVEGFGMVALESAAHGLPTVAFAVGGVPDAVDPSASGSLVRAADYAGFVDAVLQLLGTSAAGDRAAACRSFAEGKTWTRFGMRLRTLVAGDHASR